MAPEGAAYKMPYRAILRFIHYDGTFSTHSLLVRENYKSRRDGKPAVSHFKLLKPSTWCCRKPVCRNAFEVAKREKIIKESVELDAAVDWSDMMQLPLDSLHTATMRDGTRHIMCSYDDLEARERIKSLVKGTSFDELLHGGYDPANGASRCHTIHLTLTPDRLNSSP
ncbi:hypothetical protein L0F63_004802 [Massospora cicadina]|nr:hypothetical protein L0F63_004802 [Massospora cicadina]